MGTPSTGLHVDIQPHNDEIDSGTDGNVNLGINGENEANNDNLEALQMEPMTNAELNQFASMQLQNSQETVNVPQTEPVTHTLDNGIIPGANLFTNEVYREANQDDAVCCICGDVLFRNNVAVVEICSARNTIHEVCKQTLITRGVFSNCPVCRRQTINVAH